MLYIKFNIQDQQKFKDFQKIYDHMVMVRQPDFVFEEDVLPDFDWDNMTEEETKEALEIIDNFFDQDNEDKRYNDLFPNYADVFLKDYIKSDKEIAGAYGFDIKGIFNYLEFSFEVDLDSLIKLNEIKGEIKFSTGNYPFGGLERFIMTLKSFGLISFECFDGFNVASFKWNSEYNYTAIINDEETKLYKQNNF